MEDKRIHVNLTTNHNKSVLDYLFEKFSNLKERKECLKILLIRKELNLNKKDFNGNTLLMRLLLKFKKKEEEEKFDYFRLKDIIIMILTDSRTDIFLQNKEGKSLRNITNDIDILKILTK